MARTWYCRTCLNTFGEDIPHCPNLGCGSPRPTEGWDTLLSSGDLLDRNYRIDEVLAVGGSGIAYRAQELDPEGQPAPPDLAIKVLYARRASGSFLNRLATEAQVLRELDHPHIVECRGFVHRTGALPYLVTLYEPGGTLTGHISRVGALPPKVALGVLRQILLALDTAHQRGVIHRDLKPENVLLRQVVSRGETPHVRVADFGIAKVQGAVGPGLTQAGGFVGTPEYAAPEQFEGRPPSPATDVYAAGALLYFLLTGAPPIVFHNRADIGQCYAQLLSELPPKLQLPGVEEDGLAVLQDLVHHTMRVDAGERWTTQQILQRMRDLGDGVGDTDVHVQRPQGREAAGATFVMPPGSAPGSASPTMTDTVAFTEEASTHSAEPQAEAELPIPEPTPEPLKATADAPTPAPPPSDSNDLSLDDLFSNMGPEPVSEQHHAPDETPSREPSSESGSAAGGPPPAVARAGYWRPKEPETLPAPLPDSAQALLRLLGSVAIADRSQVLEGVQALDRRALDQALATVKPSGDPAFNRGAALAIATLERQDRAQPVRRLLSDPDPAVRACAAQALGVVGGAGMLASLNAALQDTSALVRAAAARAIGVAGPRLGREGAVRGWLKRVAQDPSEEVRDAYRCALTTLTGSTGVP